MAKPKKRRVNPSHGNNVSIEQYNAGYKMFRTGVYTVNRLAAGTRMTREQVGWCVTHGDESRGMPAWISVLDKEVSAMQTHGIEVAKNVGEKGAALIDVQMDIISRAQSSIQVLLETYVMQNLVPVVAARRKGEDVDITDMEMPAGMRHTLKALKGLTDTKSLAATFAGIYDSRWFTPQSPAQAIGKAGAAGVSPEAMLPASVALIEEGPANDAFVDPVQALLGIDATDEDELRRYLDDNELPGDTVDSLLDAEIERVLDVEASEDTDRDDDDDDEDTW